MSAQIDMGVNTGVLSSMQHQATATEDSGGADSGTLKSLIPAGLVNLGANKNNESGVLASFTFFGLSNVTGALSEKIFSWLGFIGEMFSKFGGNLSEGFGAGSEMAERPTVETGVAGPAGSGGQDYGQVFAGANPQDGDGGGGGGGNPQDSQVFSNFPVVPDSFKIASNNQVASPMQTPNPKTSSKDAGLSQ